MHCSLTRRHDRGGERCAGGPSQCNLEQLLLIRRVGVLVAEDPLPDLIAEEAERIHWSHAREHRQRSAVKCERPAFCGRLHRTIDEAIVHGRLAGLDDLRLKPDLNRIERMADGDKGSAPAATCEKILQIAHFDGKRGDLCLIVHVSGPSTRTRVGKGRCKRPSGK